MENALEAIKIGTSVLKASKDNKVSYKKLQKAANELFTSRYFFMPRGGGLLYPDEEASIHKYIVMCSENGFPRSNADICEAVGRIVENFPRPVKAKALNNGIPTRNFVRRFLQRHKDLSFRIPSNVPAAGALVTETSMDNWFLWLESYLNQNDLLNYYQNNPDNIFNLDESPIPSNPRAAKALGKKDTKKRYKVAPPNSREYYTMLATASASGIVLNPFMVLKGTRVSEELRQNIPEHVNFALENEGYMTQDVFLGKLHFKYDFFCSQIFKCTLY